MYLFWNGLPVWPIYFLLQSGHVMQYTPLFSNCCCGSLLCGLGVSSLLIVLLTLKAILNCVSSKSLVMALVSFPKYVNLAHNSLLLLLLVFCPVFLKCFTIDGSHPLLLTICSITCCSFYLLSSKSV